ncbi:MAG: glutamate mutase L [Anaerolineae bacterium]|nr:glutamate mutase L [Anaerolineae bacterium]
MAANRYGSILAADFGNVHTRLILIDTVDGSYRLVSRAEGRTTGDFPFNDISVGLARTATELGKISGRMLLDAARQVITPEQSTGAGVDYFVATASIGRPLRAVLVGLVPEISIASAIRAAAGSYIEIVEILSLDDRRSEEEQVNAIISSQPDLVLITGGTDGGAEGPVLELAQVIELTMNLVEIPRRPVVVFAGNRLLANRMEDMFAGLTSFFASPNVRPSLAHEDLDNVQLQLGHAFDQFKENRGGGFDTIGGMVTGDVLPTAQSADLMAEYLGRTLNSPVLLLDVGSAVSTLSTYINDAVHTVIRTDIGLGHSAYHLLEGVGLEAIRAWLPFYASDEEIMAYARNKTLRPATIPQNAKDLYLEHALLRAGIRALVRAGQPIWYKDMGVAQDAALPAFDPIIGSGAGLTGTGHAGYTALLLLDALQPEGVTQLQTDPYGVLPALGALSYVKPDAVVQVLDTGALQDLGTSISLSGAIRGDRAALDIRISTEDGETLSHQLLGGHLWVYPLAIGERARVEVSAMGRGTSIGGKRRIQMDVVGGSAGVIFDARGRPLSLAEDVQMRALQMPMWVAEVTGDPVQVIDERWLQPVQEALPEIIVEEAPAARRGWRRGRRQEEAPDEEATTLKELEPAADENELMDDLRDALR